MFDDGQRDWSTTYSKPFRHAADVLGADVLEAFSGRATVRILERRADGVILERLEPGTPLSALVANGEDREATRILAWTVRRMHAESIPAGVPSAVELAASFGTYLASGDERLPRALVRAANAIYVDLCGSQRRVRLLHGDLHHDNVLFDARRGWVAIDPKGVIAELEYEVSVALRNPVARPDVFCDPDVFIERVACVTQELRLNAGRVKQWAFATAVLAAIWTIEDDDDPAVRGRWIAFADAIQPIR